ncbi:MULTISPECIES: pentapeptide repeat-containing protein [unclassified Nonomuraea]|uniref:pentapeptide repeat-containing protein n=1 Tax=unclassified Nonomuraea TaxID=2593643 RepID=UPI0033DC0A2A
MSCRGLPQTIGTSRRAGSAFHRALGRGGDGRARDHLAGDVWFGRVTFSGDARFNGATFIGDAMFAGTRGTHVWLAGARVRHPDGGHVWPPGWRVGIGPSGAVLERDAPPDEGAEHEPYDEGAEDDPLDESPPP